MAVCTVTGVSDSASTCAGAGVRAGDRIGVDRTAAAPVPAYPALPTRDELEAQRAALARQTWVLVDEARQVEALRETRGFAVAFSHQGFFDFGSRRASTGLERLDLSLVEVALGRGCRLRPTRR